MYEKSKKTWSQRLKITKTDKLTNASDTQQQLHQQEQLTAAYLNGSSTNNANFLHAPPSPTTAVKLMQMPPTSTLQALQQLQEYHGSMNGQQQHIAYELLPGNVTRSLKYAEPSWIYGTVRGVPTRPYHHYHQQMHAATGYAGHPHAAAIFAAPHPLAGLQAGSGGEHLAVVICSCPEYLNGTKRDQKKASVCKKCKGSRLPLTTIGGTMRLPSMPGPKLRTNGVATMRVVSSTKKARPTILDPQKDPYDMMRRTRLSLEPIGTSTSPTASNAKEQQEQKQRNRGKSISPQRGRSRQRGSLLLQAKQQSNAGGSNEADCWLEEDAETLLRNSPLPLQQPQTPSTPQRRSILRCNVNPYDLISINAAESNKAVKTGNSKVKSAASSPMSNPSPSGGGNAYSQYEFQPPPRDDDFNVEDAALYDELPPFATNTSNGSSSKTAAKSPKLDAAASSDKKLAPLSYNNVQAIAGQRISLGGEQRAMKPPKKPPSEHDYESICIDNGTGSGSGGKNKASQSQLNLNQKQQKPVAKATMSAKPSTTQQPKLPSKTQSPQQQQPKRPPRIRKPDNAEEPAPPTKPANETLTVKKDEPLTPSAATILTVTPPAQHIKSILKRPNSIDNDASAATQSAADCGASPKSQRQTKTVAQHKTALSSSAAKLTATSPAAVLGEQSGGTSQFYIPMPLPHQTADITPQRKKVQFMVEDRIIHDDDDDDDKADDEVDEEEDDDEQADDGEADAVAADINVSADDATSSAADSQLQLENQTAPSIDVTNIADADGDTPQPSELANDATSSTMTTLNYEYYQHKRKQQLIEQRELKQRAFEGKPLSDEQAVLEQDSQQTEKLKTGKEAEQEVEVSNAKQVFDVEAKAEMSNDLTGPNADSTAMSRATMPQATKANKAQINKKQQQNHNEKGNKQNSSNATDYEDIESNDVATATADGNAANQHNHRNNKIYEDIKLPLNGNHNNNKNVATTIPTKAKTTNKSAKSNNENATATAQPQANNNGNSSGSNKANSAANEVMLRSAAPATKSSTTKTAATPNGSNSNNRNHTQQQRPKSLNCLNDMPAALKVQADTSAANIHTNTTADARNPIRRANSERHMTKTIEKPTKSNDHNVEEPQLASTRDTMAIRNRAQQTRKNSKEYFQENAANKLSNGSSSSSNNTTNGKMRPREPPPPPPASPSTMATTTTLLNNKNDTNQQEITNISSTPTPSNIMKNGNIESTATGASSSEDAEDISKTINIQQETIADNSELLSRGQQFSASKEKRTIVHVNAVVTSSNEVHRLKITHTDEHHNELDAVNHNSKHPNNGQHQQSNSDNKKHNSNNSSDVEAQLEIHYNNQKKTSILINGDDCYSTMNLSTDAATPLYQSSVVVADGSNMNTANAYDGLKMTTTTSNTVTINVSSPRSAAEELIYQHNKLNTLLSRRAKPENGDSKRAIIPIKPNGSSTEVNLQRSASTTSSASTSSTTSISSSGSTGGNLTATTLTPKRGRTLIRLDYEQERKQILNDLQAIHDTPPSSAAEALSHEEELLKILRNPVEAVKRNLVPHVCGRMDEHADNEAITLRSKKMKEQNGKPQDFKPTTTPSQQLSTPSTDLPPKLPFIAKLLEDPMLSQVADGLESDTIAELIENSLKRLQVTRKSIDITGTKDNDNMDRLITMSLQKLQEERQTTAPDSTAKMPQAQQHLLAVPTPHSTKDDDRLSNRGSISSANSFASANYEMFDFDANESDCYQSCSSDINSTLDDDASSATTRSKFYQMLVDATLAEIEMSAGLDGDNDEHHYESIRHNGDPIYEEITDVPPPLPLTAPPINDADFEKKSARSIFEGASKYDILSYLVDAKERGLVPWREDNFEYPAVNLPSTPIIIEEEASDTLSDLEKLNKLPKDLMMSSRASVRSDSSEDNHSTMSSLSPPPHSFICGGASLLQRKCASSDIERNDSGVGSETSKSSRSKYQQPLLISKNSPLHLCEDCDGPVETQLSETGELYAPLVCRKCGKKRVERKEIITEIVETEEKYGRDLQIILEEFYHPMLVAGLLTQEQLSAIFLNTEDLLENNQTLAERMRDALDIALEQGDDDLLTVNVGRIFLDFTQMLHAFESYCVRQANASLLLANLEKEKELLRIFLKVSQMENAVLRRMNLNSFLMVPVQRVTKYPLLLARLYKVTPAHLEGRELLKQAQEKIELHLNHINQEAKDVPTKLWRRISSSSPNRRASCEIDMINIKLRKMAIDILEWNHDEVRFVMEGKLLYTQPTDNNWKKARTIKLTAVNALLVTNGKPNTSYKTEKVPAEQLKFPKHNGIREASLLVVKEKCGRYTLLREPLYLDRCVVCSEADWDDYFEVQEIATKDTFIFKAEDSVRTKQWYTQLQFHAQGMGAWRKRRNALANIMINGMLTRA